MHPDLQRFKVRLKLKYEIQRFISLKNKNYNIFKKEMDLSTFFIIQLSINVSICIYIFFSRSVILYPFSVLVLFE